jgi:hypothetical protein
MAGQAVDQQSHEYRRDDDDGNYKRRGRPDDVHDEPSGNADAPLRRYTS